MHTLSLPNWFSDKQAVAREHMSRADRPRKSDEAWRYTSLEGFFASDFIPAESNDIQYAIPEELQYVMEGADHTLCFYNGAFLKMHSKMNMQEQVLVVPLSRALMSAGRVQENIKKLLPRDPNDNLKSIGWSNRVYARQGAFIDFQSPKDKPLKVAVINLYGNLQGYEKQVPFAVYPRNIYSFGPEVEAEIFEAHLTVNDIQFQVCSSSDWILGQKSNVEVAQLIWLGEESYLFNDSYGVLQEESNLKFINLSKNGKLTRNELDLRLKGAGAKLGLYSLSIADRASQVDLSSHVHHQVGATESEQIAKSILKESSRAVFSGRLVIEEDAQRSDASQYNHNLLLSDSAEVNSRPQLEVNADDVKAAHGATIGRIDENELFYLQSRGISRDRAEKMLAYGFEAEIVKKLSATFLREKLIRCLEASHFYD